MSPPTTPTQEKSLVDRGRLQAGGTVLITAAAGGVGSAAGQITAAMGAGRRLSEQSRVLSW